MHREGEGESVPVALGCVAEAVRTFGLTAASPAWPIAADWALDRGDSFGAALLVARLYEPGSGSGYGYGSGDGDGDGYGAGSGSGSGDGDGDGE